MATLPTSTLRLKLTSAACALATLTTLLCTLSTMQFVPMPKHCESSTERNRRLRERVAEMLRKEPRVANFRIGAWNEGGAGVTVVEL